MSGIRDFTFSLTKNVTGFSDQWAYRFQTVVDELCNNAIEFGSATDKEIYITFLTVPGEYLEIFVEDTGTGTSKMTPEELKQTLVERKEKAQTQHIIGLRGRGLVKIVSEWSDELEFLKSEHGGTKVRVRKYLHAEENATLQARALQPLHVLLQ